MDRSLQLSLWLGLAGAALIWAHLLLRRTRHTLGGPQRERRLLRQELGELQQERRMLRQERRVLQKERRVLRLERRVLPAELRALDQERRVLRRRCVPAGTSAEMATSGSAS